MKIEVFLVVLCLAGISFGQTLLWNQAPLLTIYGRWAACYPVIDGRFYQTADDFVVPLGARWEVQMVQYYGFFQPNETTPVGLDIPLSHVVQIYPSENIGGYELPGQAPLYNKALKQSNPNNIPNPVLVLDTPLLLYPGRYWLSVYANFGTTNVVSRWYARDKNTTTGNFRGSLPLTFRNSTVPWYKPIEIQTTGHDEGAFVIAGLPFYDTSAPTSTPTSGPSSQAGSNTVNTTVPATDCPIGRLGCACASGGFCDPGLQCAGVSCALANVGSSNKGGNTNTVIIGSVVGVGGALILLVAAILVVVFIRRRQPAPAIVAMTPRDTLPPTNALPSSQYNKYTDIHGRNGSYEETSMTPIAPDFQKTQTSTGFEIDYAELEFEREVGRGSYGVVFLGRWRGGVVAIKQLLVQTQMSSKEIGDFKKEAAVMSKLRPHVNVVQFLGITLSPRLCIVTEFLEQGSLFNYVFSEAKIDSTILMNISKGIAAGMMHLHREGIVHRDLATRNVLLGDGNGIQVKISDFGLSRVNDTAVSSQKTNSTVGPLKWMSPESILKKEYSVKSDVWSFGVTLYEIVARCEPYGDMDPVLVAVEVTQKGLRLDVPTWTPKILADIMTLSFSENPNLRPDFQTIGKMFREASSTDWMIRT